MKSLGINSGAELQLTLSLKGGSEAPSKVPQRTDVVKAAAGTGSLTSTQPSRPANPSRHRSVRQSQDSEGLDDNGAAEDDDSTGSRTAAWEQALLWAQPDSGSGFFAGDLPRPRRDARGRTLGRRGPRDCRHQWQQLAAWGWRRL